MRAPVSWIREYVDLPAEVDADELADRLTALGLKLEALDQPGDDDHRPARGRPGADDRGAEPQKNGKTIQLVHRRRRRRQRHRRAPGDRLRRAQLRARRPGRGVLPGGVLPGGFEIGARKTYGHVSAGHDLLGARARARRRPRRHHRAAADAGEPGDDAFDVLGLDDEVIEFEINPDRAYALSLRGIAREAALGSTRRSTTRPTATTRRPPTATATRSSSRTRPAARSSWPAR